MKKRVVLYTIWIFLFLYSPTILHQQYAYAGQSTSFLYDGDGIRVAKIENGRKTVYVGIYEKDLVSGKITKYLSFGGKNVVFKDNNGLKYIVSDHLGSTRTTISNTGTRLTDAKYYPYGLPRTPTSLLPSRQYTGQISDDSTGLYFYNARYYDPQTAKFITADSAQGANRYSYVSGNPLTNNDPTGHDEEDTQQNKVKSNLNKIFRQTLDPNFFWYFKDNPERSLFNVQTRWGNGPRRPGPGERPRIDLTNQQDMDEFFGKLGNIDTAGKDKLDQVKEISSAYRKNVGSFYRGACIGASMGTFLALKGVEDIESVFLDITEKTGSGSYYTAHSVLGTKIDNEWYIIDNSLSPEGPIILPKDDYAEYFNQEMKNRNFSDRFYSYVLTHEGDPFGLTDSEDLPWLIRPPTISSGYSVSSDR
jgi:RHS repeat-associated protein